MQTWPKILVLLILAGIVACMGSALYQLARGGDSRTMFRALVLRVGLSVGLFCVLILLWWLGLIAPHALGAYSQ